ncbi:MAG: hypothetical protein SGJ20_04580 [Planctomycetota bacterium]|nr:hypothetical protein [Planctomycetota bacterium]
MSEINTPKTGRQLDAFDPGGLLREQSEPPVLVAARELALRSQRRVFWLTVATIITWTAACSVGIATLWINHYEFGGLPHAEYHQFRLLEQRDTLTELQSEDLEKTSRQIQRIKEILVYLTQTSIILFGVAALLSVWLTIASRRASLRQINANLMSITLELKKVLAASPPK